MSIIATRTARVTASYPMFGDMEASKWADLVFGGAKRFEDIRTYEIKSVTLGTFGLQTINFEVTMDLDPESEPLELQEEARCRLNKIVNDTDVTVETIQFI